MKKWHIYLGALFFLAFVIISDYITAKNSLIFVLQDDFWRIVKAMSLFNLGLKIIAIILAAKLLLHFIPH
ncbi:hypothetical protein HSX37_04240|uniref:Uncharacterized protein n=1 Tax=Dendrosporobacter quercicolus TaxID=146817 RepID=A0A1G9N8H9_9FIRM|nr:hypothetical protein [Dendrosporobacter quercicolus]NSL47264.1 hypothetical protein [Dendrosporobacter quercicolus DSM 1736]SDL82836.1 hypothetical protein SAMN04488502_101930 [Dendrosporobacter quercicolus]